jgi:hypothetical protein
MIPFSAIKIPIRAFLLEAFMKAISFEQNNIHAIKTCTATMGKDQRPLLGMKEAFIYF